DGRIFRCHLLHHAEGVIAAAIEHHHELEFSLVMLLKKARVIPKHRLNAPLFVVRWNQQQNARTGHALSLSRFSESAPRNKGDIGAICVWTTNGEWPDGLNSFVICFTCEKNSGIA